MMIHTLPAVLILLLAARIHDPGFADIVFTHGRIYTVSAKQPRAEAIGVKGGRIVFVGSDRGGKAYIGQATRVVDLHGATAVPGFTDSHYHLSGVGMRELSLNLEGSGSLEEMLSRVRERVEKAKPGEWIVGRGWIEAQWNPPVFPSAKDLDRVSPANPVYLIRADGHGAVVNTLALQRARITKNTANPFGGEIMRDKSTGEPNGMLLDSAQNAVRFAAGPALIADLRDALIRGARAAREAGLTQVQIAGTQWGEGETIRMLQEEGRLKLRTYVATDGPGADADRLCREGALVGADDNRFTRRGIKVVLDGALGSKGAALLEPYSDYDTRGFLTQKEENVVPMLEQALRAGIQVETHAIGDRAVRTILDWYEKALAAVPPDQRRIKEPRWRIEHSQIVNPSDIPRYAKLGVIPSMQASHAITDLHFAPSRLGMKRLEGAYAWKSFLKSGCIIAGGSDAPVEKGDPIIEFYAAVARRDLKGFTGEGWHPEQAVTREEALKMLTLWPAYASFEENLRGSLETGKLADMTVLSADIMRIPFAEIPKTRCLMTIIGGDVVYDARDRAR